jgi:hypothetical protein
VVVLDDLDVDAEAGAVVDGVRSVAGVPYRFKMAAQLLTCGDAC